MKVLVGKCCVPMSTFAFCSSCECSFLEVQFDKRLPQHEAEHLGSYCPIPHRAKRCTWLWTLCIWPCEEFCNVGLRRILQRGSFVISFCMTSSIEHHVCYCGLPASSSQLKTISWPWPPGYIVNIFIITSFVSPYHCQSVRLFMEWVASSWNQRLKGPAPSIHSLH